MILKFFGIQCFLAVMVSVLALVWQVQKTPPDARAGDAYAYLSVAKDLADTGIYTDGRFQGAAAARGANGEGMFFAPLYPALVAGVMKIDPVFYATVSCHMGKTPEKCGSDFGYFRCVQIALAAISALLIWLSGWVLMRRLAVAWMAMGLALLTGEYAAYTGQIMTETLVFPLFTGATLSAAAAWRIKNPWLWLLAGALLGLAALTRPSFAYLFYAGLVGIVGAAFYQITIIPFLKRHSREGGSPDSIKSHWMPACAGMTVKIFFLFLAGYLLTVSPWIVRNGLKMGEYGISKGYDSFILVQRVAYNEMSWKEWGASFIYGLPDFGDSLAKDLFAPQDYARLDYQTPDGFYARGNGVLRDETLKKAGGAPHHLAYLLKTEVLGNAFKHIMVTFSLAWRGMWVAKYWGLVTIPVFIGVFMWAACKKWGDFLIFSIPPWFMLGFHAFTSVNVVRYNLILIPALAVAGAFLSSALISAIQKGVRTRFIK